MYVRQDAANPGFENLEALRHAAQGRLWGTQRECPRYTFAKTGLQSGFPSPSHVMPVTKTPFFSRLKYLFECP